MSANALHIKGSQFDGISSQDTSYIQFLDTGINHLANGINDFCMIFTLNHHPILFGNLAESAFDCNECDHSILLCYSYIKEEVKNKKLYVDSL